MKQSINRKQGILPTLLLTASSLLLLGSCNSLNDGAENCEATYQVRFRYDMNMKYADAFEHEVRAVTLYVVDPDGNIVSKQSADAEELDANNGVMTLRGINPGTYSLLAWCTTNAHDSYTMGEGDKMTDLTCAIKPHEEDGRPTVEFDLDALYHGLIFNQVMPDSVGTHTYTVPLTKDTNRFRIVLQHIANKPLEPGQFEFALTDDNTFLDYDNSVITSDEEPDVDAPSVAYKPWSTSSALINGEEAVSADDETIDANSVIAELSTSRLMTDHSPRLTVYNTQTDSTIISIPVIDYIQLVKGFENASMDLQEYLDRQDEYNMVFFIDERGSWMQTYIYINSWKVVLMNKAL